jgi:hypothetical protein
MFPASDVKITDMCCSCNCMCGHHIEADDDTRLTGYEKRQQNRDKGKQMKKRKEEVMHFVFFILFYFILFF